MKDFTDSDRRLKFPGCDTCQRMVAHGKIPQLANNQHKQAMVFKEDHR